MKKWYYISGILLLSLGAVLGILTYCLPAREFSDNENRYLQQKPELSFESLVSGTAQEEIQAFMNDQIPGRDEFNSAAVRAQKLLGKRDINGVYIGKDGYYLEKVTRSDIDEKRFEKNIKRVESFAAEMGDVPVSLMLVPTSGTILDENLPRRAELYDADRLYNRADELTDKVTLLDIRQELTDNRDMQLYYKTDHHWTSRGARLGAAAYLESMDREYRDKQLYVFSDEFRGTLFSKVLDPDTEYDTVELAELPSDLTVVRDGKPAEMYDMGAGEEKDKYKVFFGGNYSEIDISGGEGQGTLLIVKDSFANCFVPFIADSYERIIMIDPRYYSGDLKELADSRQVTEVLFLYEMSNFCGDSYLARTLI